MYSKCLFQKQLYFNKPVCSIELNHFLRRIQPCPESLHSVDACELVYCCRVQVVQYSQAACGLEVPAATTPYNAISISVKADKMAVRAVPTRVKFSGISLATGISQQPLTNGSDCARTQDSWRTHFQLN